MPLAYLLTKSYYTQPIWPDRRSTQRVADRANQHRRSERFDPGPATLGLSSDRAIIVDDNGAGLGWDITPETVEANRYDLLSVLIHELGHVLGHNHNEGGVMSEALQPDLRPSDIDNVFANW